MRKIATALMACLFIISASSVSAQTTQVSGRVLANDNTPVASASILVKGKRTGTKTDPNGSFTITASQGDVLVISAVGYTTQEVRVTGSSVSVSMPFAQDVLEEVTVTTAMDIRRKPRELGYSVQTVSGQEIADTKRENFVNSLQGRVAGLTIIPTNGQAGASSQIVLRGFNSLSLSNSPLFIVDGVILDNSTLNETSNGGSGLGLASDRPNRNNDYTNRIGDLNPNDIESVTVLKGPEATALYGSQASSGAIVITTKKAVTGRIGVTYDNSFRIQKVTRFADLNNDYASGNFGVRNNSFTYFGPAYPEGTKEFDNVRNFFRTGFSQTHNLGIEWGFKNVGFRASGSFLDQKGVVPTNEYKKYNFRLANTTKIGKYLDISPSIQYINSVNDKPLRGLNGYLLGLYVWPTNNDIRDYEDPEGNKVMLYGTDPVAETDNPFFNVTHNRSQDKTDRYIGTMGVNIHPFDWLNVAGRFGYDTYKSQGYTFYHPLSFYTTRQQLGALDNYWREYNGYNHTINATATKKLGKFSSRLMVGTMWQDYKTEMFAIYGTGVVDSINSAGRLMKGGVVIGNSNFNQVVGSPTDSSITRVSTRQRLLQNNFGEYNTYNTRQLAYFGEVGLSYNNLLFLNYTHRFESASVFPEQNRNYNYPGFSASAIISDIIPHIKGDAISYFKLRTSLASTARLADPYRNQSVFVNNFASAQGPAYSYGFDNNNPDLRPERQKTYEIGTELKLFKNLLSFDAAYYNTLCTDQISQGYRASYATGFILNTQNAASTRNQGIEVVVDFNPIRKTNLNWNMRLNFNRARSRVLALPEAIQSEYYIADTWLYGFARGGLIRQNPATTITGYHYQRNNKGDIVISASTGQPLVEQTFTVIGDRNPDFTLGVLNNLKFKNFSLSMLWDLKVGGDIFNATEMYLTLQGKSHRTADRYTPRVVQGVLNDGFQNSATPTQNTIVIIPAFQQTYYTSMPEEAFIQKDVNWLRLRDITLNYTVPVKNIKKLRSFKSLSIFVTGNDLLLLTNYSGADPAVNGNTAGGAGVGAFGFDYGNLPTPLGLNFGLRAAF